MWYMGVRSQPRHGVSGSEDDFWELVFSFHCGSLGYTQVLRLAWQALLPADSSHHVWWSPATHTAHHFLRWSRLLAGKLQESACLPSPSITGAAATPSFVYVSSVDGTHKRFTLLSYPSSPSPFFRDSLCSPGNLSSWSSCLSTSSLQACTTKPGVFNFFFFWLNYCLYILLFCWSIELFFFFFSFF